MAIAAPPHSHALSWLPCGAYCSGSRYRFSHARCCFGVASASRWASAIWIAPWRTSRLIGSIKPAKASRWFTSRSVTPKRAAMAGTSCPSFTSRANASCWSNGSIGRRSRFSASEISSAAASSVAASTRQGRGSTGASWARRWQARNRRWPATISKRSPPATGRTSNGCNTPCARMLAASVSNCSVAPWVRALIGATVRWSSGISCSSIGVSSWSLMQCR